MLIFQTTVKISKFVSLLRSNSEMRNHTLSRSSQEEKHPYFMQRKLTLLAGLNFETFQITYLLGVENIISDFLSRSNTLELESTNLFDNIR